MLSMALERLPVGAAVFGGVVVCMFRIVAGIVGLRNSSPG